VLINTPRQIFDCYGSFASINITAGSAQFYSVVTKKNEVLLEFVQHTDEVFANLLHRWEMIAVSHTQHNGNGRLHKISKYTYQHLLLLLLNKS